MIIGCLGDIIFSVSDSAVKTITNYTRSGSARYATHDLHLSKSLLEFTGADPEDLSFDVEMLTSLGVDPDTELAKIANYTESGRTLSFVLGDKTIGSYRWVITSFKEKGNHHDGRGNVISATVSITLKEYV